MYEAKNRLGLQESALPYAIYYYRTYPQRAMSVGPFVSIKFPSLMRYFMTVYETNGEKYRG